MRARVPVVRSGCLRGLWRGRNARLLPRRSPRLRRRLRPGGVTRASRRGRRSGSRASIAVRAARNTRCPRRMGRRPSAGFLPPHRLAVGNIYPEAFRVPFSERPWAFCTEEHSADSVHAPHRMPHGKPLASSRRVYAAGGIRTFALFSGVPSPFRGGCPRLRWRRRGGRGARISPRTPLCRGRCFRIRRGRGSIRRCRVCRGLSP